MKQPPATLEDALAIIEDLEDKLADAEREHESEVDELESELADAEPIAHTCRRCYITFCGPADMQYCSRDCEYFRLQVPFEVWYKRMHPQWPEVRGTYPVGVA